MQDRDKLVGQGIRQGQQVARHSRWQAVKSDPEFGYKQIALCGLDRLHDPAAFIKKALQRGAGKKAQMRVVKQSLSAVPEIAMNELCQPPAVSCVRNGGD